MGHGSSRLSIAGAATRLKAIARACADSNQALTGVPGGSIDGVGSWAAAQVILLTGQTDASENGLWRIRSGAWRRTPDLSTGKSAAGVSTFVSQGTSHGNKSWQCTNDTGDDVVGTDDLVWVAGATAYTHPTTAGNKHVPAAGASGEVLKYDSAGTAVWASSVPSYTEVGRQLGGIKTRRLAWWPAAGTGQLSGNGMASTIFEQQEAGRYDSDTGGHYLEIDSDNETGQSKSDVYIASVSFYFAVTPISNCYFSMRFSLPTLTNVRLFAGLCQYSDRNYITTADNPGRVYAGYQFSTGRPDTNFQFVHDDSSTQTLVDTGLAPATDVVYQIELEYTSDGTALRGRISNAVTGAILMADTTHTATSTITNNKLISMAPYLGVVTLAEEMKQFRFYQAEVWA